MRGIADDCKKTIKLLIFRVHALPKSLMLIRLKTSSLVLVVMGSISTPICNRFHGRLANNNQITTFRGYRYLMPSCTGFLEPRRSRLVPLIFIFDAENFIHSLSLSICSEFGDNLLLKCVSQPKIAKKSIKNPILMVKVIPGHCSRWQSKAHVQLPISD